MNVQGEEEDLMSWSTLATPEGWADEVLKGWGLMGIDEEELAEPSLPLVEGLTDGAEKDKPSCSSAIEKPPGPSSPFTILEVLDLDTRVISMETFVNPDIPALSTSKEDEGRTEENTNKDANFRLDERTGELLDTGTTTEQVAEEGEINQGVTDEEKMNVVVEEEVPANNNNRDEVLKIMRKILVYAVSLPSTSAGRVATKVKDAKLTEMEKELRELESPFHSFVETRLRPRKRKNQEDPGPVAAEVEEEVVVIENIEQNQMTEEDADNNHGGSDPDKEGDDEEVIKKKRRIRKKAVNIKIPIKLVASGRDEIMDGLFFKSKDWKKQRSSLPAPPDEGDILQVATSKLPAGFEVTCTRVSECGKSFKTIKAMREHFTRTHGDSPFKCPTCSKMFSSLMGLKLHHIHGHHVEVDASIFQKVDPNPNQHQRI